MIRKLIRRSFYTVLLIFILPALLSQAVWQATGNEASSWNTANWSSAGILPSVASDTDAVIYVMAAKTGRWKGGFSVHSWIVTKEANGEAYNRYEVVGWGKPLRINAYAPDARWYSNEPEVIHVVRGQKAAKFIPEIQKAVNTYPHAERGSYKLWPGPNSNSFIAHVLNEVPEIGVVLPANAVGRDYLSEDRYLHIDPDWMNIQMTFRGYAGFAIGKRSGIEVNLFGLTAGLDILSPAIKLPGFGRISF